MTALSRRHVLAGAAATVAAAALPAVAVAVIEKTPEIAPLTDWAGAWEPCSYYGPGSLVKYGDKHFFAIFDHMSGESFDGKGLVEVAMRPLMQESRDA